MRGVRKVLAALVVTVSLGGCAAVLDTMERLRPAGQAVLNTAETVAALANIRTAYTEARTAVQAHRDIFMDPEWQVFERGDRTIVELAARIDQLKKKQSGATLVVSTSELMEMILPVRDAAKAMTVVGDNHLGDFDAQTRQAYLDVNRHFSKLDGQIERIISEEDRRARAEMLMDLLKLSAKLVGIAQIGLV